MSRPESTTVYLVLNQYGQVQDHKFKQWGAERLAEDLNRSTAPEWIEEQPFHVQPVEVPAKRRQPGVDFWAALEKAAEQFLNLPTTSTTDGEQK